MRKKSPGYCLLCNLFPPLSLWFQNSKDPCSRVTRLKLKLAECDFEVTYKAGKTNINPDALSRNPIDIENTCINDNDNNEEVNTSQVKLNKEDNISNESKTDDDEEEAPHMNLYCDEELNQEEIDNIKFVNDSEDFKIYKKKPESRKIDESNSRKNQQTTNGKNLLENKDNQGNYYKFKYKINDNDNIDTGNFRGNKRIPTKDGNVFKNNKGEDGNSGMNYEDIKKRKIYKNYKGTEQLKKRTLFKNTKNKKCYYEDINERKIDGTKEIKRLKNNDDNDEEYCIELDFKDLKKETIYENKEETTEKLNEGTLFEDIDNKKRYYDDIYEEKIDRTEETKQLLNEKYLLKNDDDNDEKCFTELVFKDLKNETIYGKNEETIEQLNEEDLFNITNRRLIKMITNKIKNEGNVNALYKLIGRKNILETFVSQILKYVEKYKEYKYG